MGFMTGGRRKKSFKIFMTLTVSVLIVAFLASIIAFSFL